MQIPVRACSKRCCIHAVATLFLLALAGCKESKMPVPKGLPPADSSASHRPDSVEPVPVSQASDPESTSADEDDSTLVLYFGTSYVDLGGAEVSTSPLGCREELARLLPPKNDSVPSRYKATLAQASLLDSAGCAEFLSPQKQYALFLQSDSATVQWKAVEPEIEVVVASKEAVCDIGRDTLVRLTVTLPAHSSPSPILFASEPAMPSSEPISWSEWKWKSEPVPAMDSAHLPHTDTLRLAGFGKTWFREVWLEYRYGWGGGSEEQPGMVCERVTLKARLLDGKVVVVHRDNSASGYSYGPAEIQYVQVTDVDGNGDPEFILKDSEGAVLVIVILDGQATPPVTIFQGATRMLSGC